MEMRTDKTEIRAKGGISGSQSAEEGRDDKSTQLKGGKTKWEK